jgi:HK97 family phage prohead protease
MIDLIDRITVDVKALSGGAYPHGEFVAVLSKPTTDRDNEIVAAKAFDPLPDHITIDVDHALKTSGVVGSGVPYYDGDTLMVKGRFASTALGQEIRALVSEDHIRTMSVAFRGAEKEAKDGVTTITKAELLNAAFVAIPANRDAVVLSSKAGARHSTTDREHLEALGAALVGLGWQCPVCAAGDSEPPDDTKKTATDPGDDELRLRASMLRLWAEVAAA